MARLFYQVMQDNLGNLLFGVSGTMRLAGTGTLATIYGDEALTVPIANPMTNHVSFGSFKCYLGPGAYDFYMAKSGYTFETLTGLQGLGTAAAVNSPVPIVNGGTGATNVATARGNLELGGMALQNTNAVSIGGGDVGGLNTLSVSGAPGTAFVSGTSRFNGAIGIAQASVATVMLSISHNKSSQYGAQFQATGADTGTQTVLFKNVAGTEVGSISTTAAATAYNTSSDARLKHAITALTGALDVVQALRPVAFLWNADDSEGRGFVASEVQQLVPEAVTGAPDAVDDAGQIVPQGLDMSKLVPYLVGAVQMLAEQVQALTARLDAVGG